MITLPSKYLQVLQSVVAGVTVLMVNNLIRPQGIISADHLSSYPLTMPILYVIVPAAVQPFPITFFRTEVSVRHPYLTPGLQGDFTTRFTFYLIPPFCGIDPETSKYLINSHP